MAGAPRSGTTIVAQALSCHPELELFDEVGFCMHVLALGAPMIGDASLPAQVSRFLQAHDALATYEELRAQNIPFAEAMAQVLATVVSPKSYWGEKYPAYCLDGTGIRRLYPDAALIWVVRDPLAVVGSYLKYQSEAARNEFDFWIVDNLASALTNFEVYARAFDRRDPNWAVLRYEDFVADPKTALVQVGREVELDFSDVMLPSALPLLRSFGTDQCFRDGKVLPWKARNLGPLETGDPPQWVERLLRSDEEVWAKLRRFRNTMGY